MTFFSHRKFILSILFFLFSIPTTAIAEVDLSDNNAATDVPQEERSPINRVPLDTNKYRVLTLDNGMEVVLVQSETAPSTSFSIGLGVGSWNDPEDQAGIAHFLEHMVFLKSEKYPKVDGLATFIQSKGGWVNAFTSNIHTVYNFQVTNDAFDEALDRLVAGIKAPLFDVSYVEKEINAVDSEWRRKKDEDAFATMMAVRQNLNPKHPASRFGTGNKETLSAHNPEDLLANLKRFHAKYYSAAIMRASVHSTLSLDEQEKIVTPILSKINNTPVTLEAIDEAMYTAKQLKKRIFLKGKNSADFVSYVFPFTEKDITFQDHPDFITAKLLGSMHEGGLIDSLRKLGLVHEMGVYAYKNFQDFQGTIEIEVQYTEKGRDREADVVKAIFDYAEKAKKEFITEGYVEFLQKKLNVERESALPYEGVGLTNFFVMRNPYVDIRNSFDSGYIIESFNKKAVARRLQAVHANNILVIDRSTKHEVSEPIAFSDQKKRVENSDLKKLVKTSKLDLKFSAPQILEVSQEFDEHHQFLESPELVVDNSGIQARLMHSKKFQNEKGTVNLILRSAFTSKNVENFVHSHVLHNLLHKHNRSLEQQVQERYDVSFRDTNNIFAESSISLGGPTKHHVEVLGEILNAYNKVDITQEKINIEVAPYVQSMQGMSRAGPLHQAYFKKADLLNIFPNAYSAEERIAALNKITVKSLQKFRDDYLSAAFIDIYAFGNYTEEDVKKMSQLALEKLGARKGEFVRLSKGDEYDFSKQRFQDIAFDADTNGVGYALEFFDAEKSLKTEYQAQVLASLMHPDFFESLRTEQKLAYDLGVYPGGQDGHSSITLYIHSNVAGFDVLGKSFDTFLNDFKARLSRLEDSEIASIKESFKQNLLKEPGSVYEESGEYFSEWSLRPEQYFTKEERAAAIDAVTAADVTSLFKRLIVDKKSERFRYQVRGGDFANTKFLK